MRYLSYKWNPVIMIKLKNNKKLCAEITIIMFIALSTIFISFLWVVPDDYWWHTKAGEYIFNTKSIPYTDVFSWIGISKGLSWYSHEWLSEIIIYIFSLIFNGTFGGFVYVYLCLFTLMLVLYFTNKSFFNKNYIFAVIWFLIGAICLSTVLSPRPHMISFILLAIIMSLLTKYRENDSFKGIWLIPIISFLWSNFHGGSSNLGYILVSIVLISGLFNFKIGKVVAKKLNTKQIKVLLLIIMFSILAIAINPHGFNMITYPYSNMNDTLMLSYINEWQSPDIKNLSHIKYILAVIVTFLIFMSSEYDINFTDFLFFCSFTYLSLKSIRFGALSYIVLTYIVVKYINETNFFKKVKIVFNYLTIIYMAIFLVIIISLGINGHLTTKLFEPPVNNHLINTIKETKPKSLYNPYDLGGYLIYNNIKVSIDSRADLYSKNILGDYIKFSQKLDMTLPNTYDFDYYLIYKDSTLYNYFNIYKDKYKLIEADDKNNVLYYEKIN